jgi:hypothetical protein
LDIFGYGGQSRPVIRRLLKQVNSIKTLQRQRRRFILALFALLLLPLVALCQPALPEGSLLDSYSFDIPSWLSDSGYAPIACTTNLVLSSVGYGSLLLDTTNVVPAYLAYHIVETNGQTNITFAAGALVCAFICDWASDDTNQLGTGPGDVGFLLAAGDFSTGSPDGLWAIYFDPGGTNIYFGGVSNSTSTVFVSAPISWPSNSLHVVGISYGTNTTLYLDGQLAATGTPVTIVPATNVWTNGYFVGSDAAGHEQARGFFWDLELFNSNWFNYYDGSFFTNSWLSFSNAFAAWEGSGGGDSDFSGSSGFLFSGGGSGGCATGTNVYMTNMSYAVVDGASNTFTFTIAGGALGFGYDVFSTTNLTSPLSNSVWTWLGQGTNCGIYYVTNQPDTQCFYLLGNLLASDGSGLSVAYENLISAAFSSDGYGTPNAWYLRQGLSPQIYGVGIGGDDADGDGLLNYQEYLYGTNPEVSEGFAVWVSEPELTSGIP